MKTCEQPCPVCGEKLDADSDLDGEERPRAEDVSVCIHCSAFLVFNHDLSRRQMTFEDEASLDAETLATLWRVRRAIHEQRKRQ